MTYKPRHRLSRPVFLAFGFLALILTFGAPYQAQAQGEITDQLQAALEATVASDQTQFPSAILYVSHPQQGTWVGAAGVADITTGAPLGPDARFRAGSIMKSFVATVILQLVEEGALAFDDAMTELLPEDVTSRFADSGRITLRMLLNHTSGIPEWVTGPAIDRIGADPGKVWEVGEFFDIATAQPASFPPGEGWSYSNTNYNLLGLIIEQATGQPWRDVVRERVIEPLGLADTALPLPGDTSIAGAVMHGYGLVGSEVMDLSFVDPSMAGAAGGSALVTTATDLATFMAALRTGALFQSPDTLAAMADFVDAPDVGGHVGYGLGLSRYLLPGGLEMIGHLGGTAGYRSFTGYFPQLELDITLAMSVQGDPTPVILAALEVVAPAAAAAFAAPQAITEIPPVTDADGNVIPNSIATLEQVTLGGVEQWIVIRGADTTKPVLLVLHGGPGFAMTPWVELYQRPALEENFVVVNWDQRGAGKSYSPDLTADDMTVAKLVSDTLELTDMLREFFNQDRIFLTGHSWGSALGFLAVMENPEAYHAYIASAEAAHWNRRQQMSFEWVLEQARSAGDSEVVEALESLGPFDPASVSHVNTKDQFLDRYRGGDYYTEGLWDEYLAYALGGRSPYYTDAEIQTFEAGIELTRQTLGLEAAQADYDLFRDFPASPIPIHFFAGRHDHHTPGELAEEYYEVLEAPAKSFTWFEQSGHVMMFDEPDSWAEELIRIARETLGP